MEGLEGVQMLRRTLRVLVPLLAAQAVMTAAPAVASPEKVGPPTSITALGDSITRGYNSQGSGCTAFSDCPNYSWATGSGAGVNSYFTRVKALNPSVVLSNPTSGNDAVTGAKMGELATQATKAVKGNPDAVLIEMGANDVCTSSEATMTSVASFRTSLVNGLNVISSSTPDARIVLNSIPNIFQLWNVLHKTTGAQLIWGLGKICQSMLASPTSEATADKTRRANVQKRNEEFNSTLKEVCAEYIHCHFDNGAAFAVSFVASEVNTNDYFHPDVAGQADLASTSFANGPNYADATAPTTTIANDREAEGGEGFYRAPVTVTLSATASEFAVKGTEYKLNGATGWTKYTAPISISSEGQTTVTARSVDVNGDIEASKSEIVKIDSTAPSFALSCPAGPVGLGEAASATVSEAADGGSGLAVNPDGSVALDTSHPGDGQSESVTVTDIAGNSTTHSCSYDVHYPDPGAPVPSTGASPTSTGLFSLEWTGADPSLYGITYTLQHKNAAQEEFSGVASNLSALSFAFEGEGEAEGTWTYRVQGSDATLGLTTSWSPESSPVVVDKTAPNAPVASADRAPDYAGGGGWFADSVTVSFAGNGDPALSDGSPGSGVDPASIAAPQTFTTDGGHTASGTVSDLAGNTSAPGELAVQVDSSAPSVEVSCPATALLGASGVTASVSASDGQSGLASDPSGTVSIPTGTPGPKTVERTATDNVGHSTTASCTTLVGATRVISGTVSRTLTVKSGEVVEITSTATVNALVRVQSGGSLDVEGATLSRQLSSMGAAFLRVCGSTVARALKITGSTGPVTLGEADAECPSNTFTGAARLKSNTGGVSVLENQFGGVLSVTAGAGGATVSHNTVHGALTVTGNSGTVLDHPNTVSGRSKLQ
jgi:lysophospholipase L1-like esterase